MSVPNAFTAFSFIPITINIWLVAMVGLFLFASLTLIFLSAVDARLTIIPDESNLLIAAIGIIVAGIAHFQSLFSNFSGSFIGHYALLFGPRENIFLNRGIAIIIMILFFGTIIILSRGRGMGMGDLKLAAAASLLIGWPDIMVAVVLAFIIGALFSILLIVRGRKKMKSIIPFGPFIALGILLVIFAGEYIMNGYFYLFP
jgi:prepilin signal peptidase PulO-like enzyme (type II secretory pathway)